jgi:hypothetical protein
MAKSQENGVINIAPKGNPAAPQQRVVPTVVRNGNLVPDDASPEAGVLR